MRNGYFEIEIDIASLHSLVYNGSSKRLCKPNLIFKGSFKMSKVKEPKPRNPVTSFFIAIWTVVSVYKFLFNPPPIIRRFLINIFNQYSILKNTYIALQLLFGIPFVLLVVYLVLRFVISLFDSMYFKL